MTRDYSQFLPPSATPAPAQLSALAKLGWQPFFANQVSVQELQDCPPARVVQVNRNGFHVVGDGFSAAVPYGPEATVGDWLMYDAALPAHSRVLKRKSLFRRRAPGHDRKFQSIAANIDTAFVVSSCNQDFNVARIERYIALAFEAKVAAVIVLTKPDLCDDPQSYADQALAISDRVPVVVLNARSDTPKTALADWCKPGQTVVFLGSSGVGKSTLVNALIGQHIAETGAIREDDARGRHTTRSRQLHFTPQGCGIVDTPGMREIQVAEAEEGISDLFDDLEQLATQCKFSDCSHRVEPGCALRRAMDDNRLDRQRFERWQKLLAEDKINSASLAERRAYSKSVGKMIRATVKGKKR